MLVRHFIHMTNKLRQMSNFVFLNRTPYFIIKSHYIKSSETIQYENEKFLDYFFELFVKAPYLLHHNSFPHSVMDKSALPSKQ